MKKVFSNSVIIFIASITSLFFSGCGKDNGIQVGAEVYAQIGIYYGYGSPITVNGNNLSTVIVYAAAKAASKRIISIELYVRQSNGQIIMVPNIAYCTNGFDALKISNDIDYYGGRIYFNYNTNLYEKETVIVSVRWGYNPELQQNGWIINGPPIIR